MSLTQMSLRPFHILSKVSRNCAASARGSKAAEDSRTPGRCRDLQRLRQRDSVLERGCPLPLSREGEKQIPRNRIREFVVALLACCLMFAPAVETAAQSTRKPETPNEIRAYFLINF